MLGASSRRHEAPAWGPMLPKQPARDPSLPNPDCWNLFTRDQEHLFLIILNTENRRKKTRQGHVHAAHQV